MHALKTSVHKNPNVGLYAYACSKYCLIGKEVPKDLRKEIEETLGVPTHPISICGTSLLGAFLTGNEKMLLVPENCFEEELKELDNLKIEYTVIPTHLTCLGNNILCNDTFAYVNPEYSDAAIEMIEQALGVRAKKMTLAGTPTPGSLGVLSHGKGLIGQDVSLSELLSIQQDFDVEVETGTMNFGSPFVRSGLVVTKHGFVAGDMSTGVELTTADEAFR
ncbi:MAG: translation initiation factor IF-6 [Candidatus Woesearchaeota archaeon]